MSIDDNHGPCGSEATRLSCMSDDSSGHRRRTIVKSIEEQPWRPQLTWHQLNIRNKRQIEVLNRRYPGRLELRAPQEAYNPAHAGSNRRAVRGRPRTRHPHGDGWEGQLSGPPMGPDQSVGPGGLAAPGTGGCLRALPQQSDALSWRSGRTVGYFSVVYGWRAPRPTSPTAPCRVCSRLCVSNKFSHFRQKILLSP